MPDISLYCIGIKEDSEEEGRDRGTGKRNLYEAVVETARKAGIKPEEMAEKRKYKTIETQEEAVILDEGYACLSDAAMV